MMKMNARIYGKNKFMRQLDEFKTLGIPPEDEKLWGTVAWPLRDIIEDSLRMQWFTAEFGDEIFAAIKDMPFTKPSDSYTALVLSFAKLGALWPRLAEFIEWWGLDNFTDFDYRKYPEHGKLVSAVEKVQEAYRLSIIRNTK
ncbi:MAG: hypothetical protein K6D59_01660 [Bacteroidales bacterium]|nr:hypothetical protein [Bacteroidales bacterium]